MKIIKSEQIYNIYANTTLVNANTTRYYANLDNNLGMVNGVKFIPRRKNKNDVCQIKITDELFNVTKVEDALIYKEDMSYSLSFMLPFELDELSRYYVEVSDNEGIIYKGKLILTDQDPQKIKY